ncbi:MAG: cohesin domain-containing protein [Candidatus Saccharibacteria bacterium]
MKKLIFIAAIAVASISYWHRAEASSLYTVSANQTVEEGQSFEVDWYLNTGDISINTVDLKLHFSKDILQVVDAGPGNSLFNLWIRPPAFNNSDGTISLTGGVTNGVKGPNVPVFRSVFKAIASGRAEIAMDPESMNLKNDGLGSPEALTFTALSFPVVSKGNLIAISSETHPNQDAWYRDRDFRVSFEAKSGEIYSVSFSANPDIYPDNKPTEKTSFEYSDLPDGVYYFKVNSRVSENSWQEAGVFRVQIDGSSPEEFKPVIGSDASIASGKSFLSFSTLDKTSGISHYEARIGWFGSWHKATSPYFLSRAFYGDSIAIRAYDNAGNFRDAVIDYPGYLNKRAILPIAAGIAVLAAVLAWYFFRRNKAKNKQT